jgi:hypothetical protein
MVKFLCPNGHPLNAPENLVGKAGKCPKCGTAFLVPSPEDQEEPVDTASEAPVHFGGAHKGGSDVLSISASGERALGGSAAHQEISSGSGTGRGHDELFVFLCPNGHRLNGPPSLKGKLGACPHCHSRFRIPTDEESEQETATDPAETETAEQEQTIALPQYDSPGAATLSDDSADNAAQEALLRDLASASAIHNSHLSAVLRSQWKFAHELGEVLCRLWEAKGPLGDVEIEFTSGEERLVPDCFSPALSQGNFAVFGVSEGTHTHVVVVPWNSIARCRIRKVEHLPAGLFLE